MLRMSRPVRADARFGARRSAIGVDLKIAIIAKQVSRKGTPPRLWSSRVRRPLILESELAAAISPRAYRCLNALAGAAAGDARLDRAAAEFWLGRQLEFLGVRRPAVWADGPQAACRAVATEPWTDLPRHASRLARDAALTTARRFPVRAAPPGPAQLAEAAAAAARDAVEKLMSEHLQSAVDDPVLSRRMNGVWGYRWRHHRAGKERSSAVAGAWLDDERIQAPETAVTIAQKNLPAPPAPTGWGAQWRDGWIDGWARVGRPAGRRGDSINEDWAILLESVVEQAGAAALDKAWRQIAGTLIESRRLAIYGAWIALAQFRAGPPIEDASDWRAHIRGYWRPFYEQAMAGLGWCWLTPDAIVCLPRPAMRWADGDALAIWPNGERIAVAGARTVRG
jgi:hypothetical protein